MNRKDADFIFEAPTEFQLEAFETLKEQIYPIYPLILALPQYGRPYMIATDASAYQLGRTLIQECDRVKDWRPVGKMIVTNQ